MHVPTVVSALGLLAILTCAVAAPLIAPYDPTRSDILSNLLPPSATGVDGERPHLMGTDVTGRDVFSGVVYGSRVSLSVALSAVLGA